MKKLLHFLAFVIIAKTGFSQNGLEGIIVEKYYISNAADAAGSVGVLPSGSTTYRIYVDMLPGYTFQAAYGVAGHELRFQTTTSFFNNEDFGSTVPSYSKNNARFNTVMLDSWLTGGAACALNHGILKSEDNVATGGATVINANGILANADPNAGIPLTTHDGLYAGTPAAVTLLGFTPAQLSVFDNVSNAGNLISTTNASWAVLGGASGPTAANKVLIAQFTTNGTFSFKLNVQLGTPTPGVSQNYVAENPVGNEIIFPGLIYPAPANPTALVSITSNTAFPTCDGTSVTFTATPTNGGASPSYQWKKNNSNVGSNSPTYTTGGLNNNDQIKCIMTSSIAGALNNPATSNTITALINPTPVATITATGPTTFCNKANLCTLSTQNVAGLNYQWTKNNNNISGATGSTYVPTTKGTYKVKVTTINGCTDLTPGVAIVVNALPAATVTVSGPTTFCSGANACTITANSGAGLTYQWTKGAALTPISGATGISYQPTATNNYYKVIVTNANGCTKSSPATSVTVNSNPSATITAQGPLTFCSGDSVRLVANSGAGLTYQWIRGTNNIAGATAGAYTAKQAGTYKVRVTNSNGCSKLSSGKKVVINCREGELAGESYSLNVYPNPSKGAFTLNYQSEDMTDANAAIEIVDMMGRVVYSEATEVIEGQLFKQVNMENQFAGGVYFVRLQVGEKSIVSKLIVE